MANVNGLSQETLKRIFKLLQEEKAISVREFCAEFELLPETFTNWVSEPSIGDTLCANAARTFLRHQLLCKKTNLYVKRVILTCNFCTNSSNNEPVEQPVYQCYTCKLPDDHVVCEACANRCHNGHHLSKAQYGLSSCDCNSDKQCQANISSPDVPIDTLGMLDRFQVLKWLGKGGFGNVYLCKPKDQNQFRKYGTVAVKRVLYENRADFNQKLKEFVVASKLNHPNIIKYYDLFADQNDEDSSYLSFPMEFANSGDLYQHLEECNTLEEPMLKQLCNHLSSALQYLHEANVIHGDISLKNIFITKHEQSEEMIFKVGDFGLTKEQTQTHTSVLGRTDLYSAPEVINTGKMSAKSDIWSFGVILYQAATGDRKTNLLNELKQERLDLDFIDNMLKELNYDPWIFKVIKGCLKFNPDDRFSAKEILNLDLKDDFQYLLEKLSKLVFREVVNEINNCRERKATTLNLAKQQLDDTSIALVAKLFKHLPSLQQLNLGMNRIGDAGMNALYTEITGLSQLNQLILSDNKFTSISYLALAQLSVLTSLDISHNSINSSISTQFALPTSLRKLEMRNICLGDGEINSLAESFTNMTMIDFLSLTNNIFGPDFVKLALGIQELVNLETLDLESCKIDSAGILVLSSKFSKLTKITGLNLSNNEIGKEGVIGLANNLPHLTRLQTLSLCENNLDDEDIEILYLPFGKLSTLGKINLSINKISCKGASWLAKSLETLPQLKRISLERNSISDSGIIALSTSFSKLSLLKRLCMKNNKIGDSGAAIIASSLANIKSFKYIDLEGNTSISQDGIKHFYSLIPAFVKQCVERSNCTFCVTGNIFFLQQTYRCITCDIRNSLVVCESCARQCHKGHQLEGITFAGCYCDCGACEEECKSLDVETLRKLCRANTSKILENFNSDHLSLQDVELTVKYVQYFVRMLPSFKQLTKLDLQNSNLDGTKCKLLLDGMEHQLSQLIELNLADNNLGDSGLRILSQSVPKMTNLVKLNLSKCRGSVNGLNKLMWPLEELKKLQLVDLTFNNLEEIHGKIMQGRMKARVRFE